VPGVQCRECCVAGEAAGFKLRGKGGHGSSQRGLCLTLCDGADYCRTMSSRGVAATDSDPHRSHTQDLKAVAMKRPAAATVEAQGSRSAPLLFWFRFRNAPPPLTGGSPPSHRWVQCNNPSHCCQRTLVSKCVCQGFRNSRLLGSGRLRGGRESLLKGGGLRTPPLGRDSRAPGTDQTPKSPIEKSLRNTSQRIRVAAKGPARSHVCEVECRSAAHKVVQQILRSCRRLVSRQASKWARRVGELQQSRAEPSR
jgi:hypothetical protein